MLGDKDRFLSEHSIEDELFEISGLNWPDLEAIYDDYCPRVPALKTAGESVANMCRDVDHVHATRSRPKDPARLIAKIIRRCSKAEKPFITPSNYLTTVSDLVGARILHKFKKEWVSIHGFVTGTWAQNEAPRAKVQSGDPAYLIELYQKYGCKIEKAEHGYRSVHYLVNQPIGKTNYQVEIQVRTLFEEAWGECDHAVRYPELADHEELSRFMGRMALFAGLSDELSGLALEFKLIEALRASASTDDEKTRLHDAINLYQAQDDAIKEIYEERLKNAYPNLKIK